jgi:hypothetical protein
MRFAWTKKPRKDETATSHRRHWLLKGTEARVVECRSKLGLPRCFYAMANMARTISRHRTKAAAMEAVECYVMQTERVVG